MASADFSQFVVTAVPFEYVYLFSAYETSPGTHTFFPPYTRHVYRKRFRAVTGLWLCQQSYPRSRPDMIPVRRIRVLPPPSFRFRLATDTLGLGYDLPTAGRSRDFHPLERALAGRTEHPAPAFFSKAGAGLCFPMSPPGGAQALSARHRATYTPLADAWDREWVTPLPSPII